MSPEVAERGSTDGAIGRWWPAPASAAERRIDAERIRLLIACSRGESLLGAAFGAAAALALWPTVDHHLLLLWCAAMGLPVLVRERLRHAYARTATDIRDSAHPCWARRLVACSAASGLAWGAIVTAATAAAAPQVLALIALHAAYVAVLSGLQCAWLPAFLAFAVPSTIAFAAILPGVAEPPVGPAMALLPIAIVVVSTLCARHGGRALCETIGRRFAQEEALVRLAAERDRAELAMRAKNRFLAAASHDLRQPVHAIGLYAGLLSRRSGGRDTAGVLERMQQSIAALSALFDGILDLSRLDAGAMSNAPRAVPLDPLLRRLECGHEMQARAKGLSLSLDTDTGLVAQVDPMVLERVLLNLIGNAVKFTETGTVAVTVRAEGERLSLRVRDTGCGIPADEHERIFSEYRRGRLADGDRTAGRGLGLAIVERLCRLMDASIDLVSAPGEGSEFILSIPRATADAEPCVDATRAAPLWCRRALVIDDEQDVLDRLGPTLAALGCRATTARSSGAALRWWKEADDREIPDVLIVDVGLRGENGGLEAVRRLREALGVDIPALLTTGDTACRHVVGKPSGRVRLLHKPYTARRLHEELAKLGRRTADAGGCATKSVRRIA